MNHRHQDELLMMIKLLLAAVDHPKGPPEAKAEWRDSGVFMGNSILEGGDLFLKTLFENGVCCPRSLSINAHDVLEQALKEVRSAVNRYDAVHDKIDHDSTRDYLTSLHANFAVVASTATGAARALAYIDHIMRNPESFEMALRTVRAVDEAARKRIQ